MKLRKFLSFVISLAVISSMFVMPMTAKAAENTLYEKEICELCK